MRIILIFFAWLALSSSVRAEELLGGSSFERIAEVARGFGSAFLRMEEEGGPYIMGRNNGNRYGIYFLDCNEDNSVCETLVLQASWEKVETLHLAHVNRWNAGRAYGKGYIDQKGYPVLEMTINLLGGITVENLDDTLAVWINLLSEYPQYLTDAGSGEPIDGVPYGDEHPVTREIKAEPARPPERERRI